MGKVWPPPEERLMSNIDKKDNGCWEWKGVGDKRGYGRLKIGAEQVGVHRLAYTIAKGDIPEGMVIDHLCRNPKCVNPDHLEAVSNRDNLLRGIGIVAENAKKTHCPSGHAYDSDNTRLGKDGKRYCRTCTRERWHRRVTKQAEGGAMP